MSDIEWHLETRALIDLEEYHKNPRTINKAQFEQLKRNIDKFGLIDKPIINQDDVIIAGHQRIRVLKDAGEESVECWVPSRQLDDFEIEELNYRHNENHGSWEWDILANEYNMADLDNWGTMALVEPEDETPKKLPKCKATFEFASKAELEAVSAAIEQAALQWGAKLKVKS